MNGAAGYAMPMAAVRAVHRAAPFVPLLRMEDVYITGMCAQFANISVVMDLRFEQLRLNPQEGSAFIRVVSNSPHTPEELLKIHGVVSELEPVKNGYESIYKCTWTKCIY